MREVVERKKVHNAHFWAAVVCAAPVRPARKLLAGDVLFPDQCKISDCIRCQLCFLYRRSLCRHLRRKYTGEFEGCVRAGGSNTAERGRIMEQLKKRGVEIIIKEIEDQSDIMKIAPHV